MAQRTAGIRERARAEVMASILDSARRQLAESGPVDLSLRAVARDIGMVSSAVYRYVASRDDLLTLLIVESYNDLGRTAEEAEARVDRGDLVGRWLAVCHACRDWAVAHPNDYALIYGSPVPGYAAPEDTVAPAMRVPMLLLALLTATAGRAELPVLDSPVERAMRPILATTPIEVPPRSLGPGLVAWTHIFGAISFELFGHRHDVIADNATDRRAFFDYEMRLMAAQVGIG